jgi:hypothetical protein
LLLKTAVIALTCLVLLGLLVHGLKLRTHPVFASSQLPRAAAATGTPGVTTFDVAGAAAGTMKGTLAVGIDAAGDVLGGYIDAKNVIHGYLRMAGGTVSTFDAPGAGTGSAIANQLQGTIPLAINATGTVTGTYIDSNYSFHGFVRAPSGTVTSFDVPGAITGTGYALAGQGTKPIAINAAGTIVGTYHDSKQIYHGFERTASGIITTFDATSIGTSTSYGGTIATGIDAAGDIVGTFIDQNGDFHGLLVNAAGKQTQITPSNAAAGTQYGFYLGVIPTAINGAGQITGTYTDSATKRHGFAQTSTGAVSAFDDPNAGATPASTSSYTSYIQGTYGMGVNAGGTTSGTYIDTSFAYHGFSLSPAGVYTTIDAPGAGTGMLGGTIGLGINDSGGIAGTWIDPSFGLHGFFYTPAVVPATAPTVTVTPSSSTITTAQALSVTIAVSGGAGSPTPTGSVTLTGGGYTSAAATLSSGGAIVAIPANSLTAGSDTLKGTYTPDSSSAVTYTSATGSAAVSVTTPAVPGFALSGTNITLAPGATTGNTSTITITPSGGFTGSVALTAAATATPTGAVDPPAFSFGSTTPVNITGTAAGSATLTITTTAPTSAALVQPKFRAVPPSAAGGAALACVLFCLFPVRRRRVRTPLGLLMLLLALSSGMLACSSSSSSSGGNNGSPGTTAGAYTITVTGTSGTISQNGPITLTVQ